MTLIIKSCLQATVKRKGVRNAAQWLLVSLFLSCCINPVDSFQAVAPNSKRLHVSSRMASSSSKSPEDPILFADGTAAESVRRSNATTCVSTTLFSDQADASTAKFGDVVRPKYLSNVDSRTQSTGVISSTSTAASRDVTSTTVTTIDEVEVAARLRRKNMVVAIASVAVALLNYFWQFTHPISPVQLLVGMQESSAPVSVIGENGKPTVVDFWAPWCENCKLMAPTLRQVEDEYKDKVNFVLVNGEKQASWPLIEAFGVDAIPHMALVSSDGEVETALIGPIPKRVLEADLDVLLSNAKSQGNPQPIPYRMLDVFAGNQEGRKVHFDP